MDGLNKDMEVEVSPLYLSPVPADVVDFETIQPVIPVQSLRNNSSESVLLGAGSLKKKTSFSLLGQNKRHFNEFRGGVLNK